MATQLKPFVSEPVIAVCTVFQRFAAGGAGRVPLVHPGHVGGWPGPLSVQLQALPSVSGVLPSIIRSIEPELSTRRRTLGSGGVVSVCWALPPPGAALH